MATLAEVNQSLANLSTQIAAVQTTVNTDRRAHV